MLDTMLKWWVGMQAAAVAALAPKGAGADGEEGQTLVEYALILVLIAIVVIIVLTLVGTRVNNIFNTVADVLQMN